MSLVVRKYGGTSVATPEQIRDIAQNIAQLKKTNDVIVVVSAMGSTTDQLSTLAYQVSRVPLRRELDMLLSTGERVASSLLSMALNDFNCPAVSFTGSQAGILTDDSHTNAQIVDIKPVRVEQELKNGRVVVLAGFQGVSPHTKEITTLGRGGTDLTAVSMAHYFQSQRCEILKEVDGIFSADPRIIPDAHRIPELSFEILQELTFWGAKVLHHRAAELAARKKRPLFIGLAHGNGSGTKVNGDIKMFEEKKVLSVNSHSLILKLQIASRSHGEGYKIVGDFLAKNNLPWPQLLDSTQSEKGCIMLATAPIETLNAISNLSKEHPHINLIPGDYATVTATCSGAIASDLIGQLTQNLDQQKIHVYHTLLSPMSVTYVVDSSHKDKTIKILHSYV